MVKGVAKAIEMKKKKNKKQKGGLVGTVLGTLYASS